ncbi:MAG: SPOR domain-containing protein [Acidobacteria bacterium]|nr:SPOR domain-containing protein [Acidobacteriota bacterium]
MARTYYQIELSARQLTVLLVIIAMLMVAAFALGYAAAWSMLRAEGAHGMAAVPAATTPTATAIPEVVVPTATAEPALSVATPLPIAATATPAVQRPARPTAVPPARPTPTARPAATPTPAAGEARFWVQILAGRRRDGLRTAQQRLAKLGFPPTHQRVVRSHTATGNVLYKLRVGPFPDRESAERVKVRMHAEGFPDAWVVTP